MREVISIHVGQAGVQIGNACWELYCIEHSINPQGEMSMDQSNGSDSNSFQTFFSETSKSKFVPRAVFFDLEPTVIDEIRSGTYRNLFSQDDLISGKEDAANNFCRGHYTIGKEYIDQCLDRIRKLTENCDSFQGFLCYNSIGGGTGSGVGSLLEEHLGIDYYKKLDFGFKIFPSPTLTNTVVEPYNAIHSIHYLTESNTCTFILDNEALYSLCESKLGIENPDLLNINRIIAQFSSSITASLRFEGSLNSSLAEFAMNLVPYPRQQFLISSLAPLISNEECSQDFFSVSSMTKSVFDPASNLATCNTAMGKYLACSMMFRGDIVPYDINCSIAAIKKQRTVSFVDWIPTGFKIGINHQPPSVVPDCEQGKASRSCCLISNSTSVVNIFSQINHKFDLMYCRRAFVHWYVGEGQSEGEFSECREDLAALEKDYDLNDQNSCIQYNYVEE